MTEAPPLTDAERARLAEIIGARIGRQLLARDAELDREKGAAHVEIHVHYHEGFAGRVTFDPDIEDKRRRA